MNRFFRRYGFALSLLLIMGVMLSGLYFLIRPGPSVSSTPLPVSAGSGNIPSVVRVNSANPPVSPIPAETGSGGNPANPAVSAKTAKNPPSSVTSPATTVNTSGTSGSSANAGSSGGSGSYGSENPPAPTPTPVTQFQIIFLGPGGQPDPYVPPVIPPAVYNWALYTNSSDHYSLVYPSNWQVIKSVTNGHEGVAIYPPGSDPANNESESIGFGWSYNYSVPQNSLTVEPLVNPIIIDNVPGKIYTQGALGQSFIAAILPYREGYFGLGSSISSPDFIYAFAYMLSSLKFF